MGGEKVAVEQTTSVEHLARKHDVPTLILAAANGLSPSDTVKAGKSIVLPMDPPEGESFYDHVEDRGGRRHHRGGGEMVAYKVHRGDSLATISRKTGISIAQLKRSNPHMNWSNVHRGQKLNLYASAERYRGESREERRHERRMSRREARREALLARRGGRAHGREIAMASMMGDDSEPARPHSSRRGSSKKSQGHSSARISRRSPYGRRSAGKGRGPIRSGQKHRATTNQRAENLTATSPSM